jgi:ribosome recycling factor
MSPYYDQSERELRQRKARRNRRRKLTSAEEDVRSRIRLMRKDAADKLKKAQAPFTDYQWTSQKKLGEETESESEH